MGLLENSLAAKARSSTGMTHSNLQGSGLGRFGAARGGVERVNYTPQIYDADPVKFDIKSFNAGGTDNNHGVGTVSGSTGLLDGSGNGGGSAPGGSAGGHTGGNYAGMPDNTTPGTQNPGGPMNGTVAGLLGGVVGGPLGSMAGRLGANAYNSYLSGLPDSYGAVGSGFGATSPGGYGGTGQIGRSEDRGMPGYGASNSESAMGYSGVESQGGYGGTGQADRGGYGEGGGDAGVGGGGMGDGVSGSGDSATGSWARGGYVQGPGTGTSDSIRDQNLSNGEFVMDADSTAMLGPEFLQRLNAMKGPRGLLG